MNSNRDHIWRGNGATGVTDRGTGQDPFAEPYISFDDDEKERTDNDEERPGRKRKRLICALIFFLVLVVGGVGLWVMFGSSAKRINLQVRDNAHKTEQVQRDPESIMAQAIAEVRSATATPTPAVGV